MRLAQREKQAQKRATKEGRGGGEERRLVARSHKASTALCPVRGNFSQKRRCNQQFPRYHEQGQRQTQGGGGGGEAGLG